MEVGAVAPGSQFPVGRLVGTDGDIRVEEVRDCELEGAELLLEISGSRFEGLDLVAEFGHRRLALFGLVLEALSIQVAYFLGSRVAPCLEFLDVDQNLSPRRVDLEQPIERRFGVAGREHVADEFGVGAKEVAGEHGCSSGGDYSSYVVSRSAQLPTGT